MVLAVHYRVMEHLGSLERTQEARVALDYLLLRTQHEEPFINTSEATKWSSERTEKGKCINVTNRGIRVFYKILLSTLTGKKSSRRLV